jgi:transcriptional regulator with XRE-family HTH domain
MALEGPIGERIRIYRQRRGLSQRELAGLIQRSESWLSQVERGIRSVDKLSVLIDIAKILKVKVETLSGQPFSLAPNGEPELDGMAAIQDALGAYPGLGVTTPPPARLQDIERMTTEVHLRYQSADYSAATRILPSLIKSVDGLVAESRGEERRRALELQSSMYVAAAKLVTKVGNGELAWLTADRAATAALHADSPTLAAAAAYQVACAFLKNDRLDDAETIALVTAANLDDDSPAGLSVRGALTLIAAVIAGRRNDRGEAAERLQRAQLLAEQLGEDANHA